MLISHSHKFITIDIPKTATRSLRETLVPQNVIDIVGEPRKNVDFYQHGTAQQCLKSLRKSNKNFSDYFSFVIVRNPWDRYYSFLNTLKNMRKNIKIKTQVYHGMLLKSIKVNCAKNYLQIKQMKLYCETS